MVTFYPGFTWLAHTYSINPDLLCNDYDESIGLHGGGGGAHIPMYELYLKYTMWVFTM